MALGISVLPEKVLEGSKVMMGSRRVIFILLVIVYTRCKRCERSWINRSLAYSRQVVKPL